jgi:hypothetical protein
MVNQSKSIPAAMALDGWAQLRFDGGKFEVTLKPVDQNP